MNLSNITAYKSSGSEFQMYYGKAAVGEGYYLANGDEKFYQLMGNNACYSIPELLHPDDTAVFLEAVEKLDEQPQCLIIRLRCYNNEYRCLYVVLKYNGRVFHEFRSFDMEFCEIMSIKERFVRNEDFLRKYREFMTLFPGMFFEYDYETDALQIYEYCNIRYSLLYYSTLEETYQNVQKSVGFSQEEKAEFQILYEAVKNGRDHFKADVVAAFLGGTREAGIYKCNCCTMYKEDIRDKVVGLIFPTGEKQAAKTYYLSESAYDPGTGLLNKRAINEYAIEKIQNRTKGLYLAIIDIDDFKRINDNFGHLFGDEVLSKVSEIMKSVLDFRGVAGRFGGDEFMIVFEGIESEKALRQILGVMSRRIQWAFNEVEGLTITTSIGIVKYPEDGLNYDELFQKADKSLYIAKAKGKNRYIIYDEKKHGSIVNENAADKGIGLKVTISDEKKHAAVSEFVLKLHRESADALKYVMEQMKMYFDIDGVALYNGRNLKRIDSVGNYVNPIQNLTCMYESSYQEFFNEEGVYEESQIMRLENKSPLAYQLYTRQGNGKFIQCAVISDGKPLSVVAFDFFNRAPKLGTTDIGLIKIVGRLMAEIIAE